MAQQAKALELESAGYQFKPHQALSWVLGPNLTTKLPVTLRLVRLSPQELPKVWDSQTAVKKHLKFFPEHFKKALCINFQSEEISPCCNKEFLCLQFVSFCQTRQKKWEKCLPVMVSMCNFMSFLVQAFLLGDCNRTQTHNHLVCKQTLKH